MPKPDQQLTPQSAHMTIVDDFGTPTLITQIYVHELDRVLFISVPVEAMYLKQDADAHITILEA